MPPHRNAQPQRAGMETRPYNDVSNTYALKFAYLE
jgi:hypothetical protein